MKRKSCTLIVGAAFLASTTAWAAETQNADGSTSVSTSASISPIPAKVLSAAQRAEARTRLSIANQLAARYEQEANEKKWSAAWKPALMQSLLQVPSSELKSLSIDAKITNYHEALSAANVAKTSGATARTRQKLIGDTLADLVYTPITPCRLADTRFAGLGPIPGGTARGFAEESSGTQGGDPNCSTAIAAVGRGFDDGAYAVNLTVVNMATTGFVAVRPVGASQITSLVNFTGPGQQVNNFAIVENLNNSVNEFEVYASTSVDVIVDVFGVFSDPAATQLDCVRVTTATSVPANSSTGTNLVSCPTGYTALSAGYFTLTSGFFVDALTTFGSPNSPWTGSQANCIFRNTTAGALTGNCNVICCRIPGH